MGAQCDAMPAGMFDLPGLNGTWEIDLTNVNGTLQVIIENNQVVRYDQGDGTLQDIEETPLVTQVDGELRFAFRATQAFVGFNNGQPTEFIVDCKGVILENGTVDLAMMFTAIDTGDDGVLEGIMRLVE